jgi:hypothetical protein
MIVFGKNEYFYGSACSVWDPHTAEHCNKIEMVQRRAARYACNRYHTTSSITDMLQTLTWPTLQQRRLKTKLIMFYKIVHHIVAVPTTILIPTDPRIRQFHPIYIQTSSCIQRHCIAMFRSVRIPN